MSDVNRGSGDEGCATDAFRRREPHGFRDRLDNFAYDAQVALGKQCYGTPAGQRLFGLGDARSTIHKLGFAASGKKTPPTFRFLHSGGKFGYTQARLNRQARAPSIFTSAEKVYRCRQNEGVKFFTQAFCVPILGQAFQLRQIKGESSKAFCSMKATVASDRSAEICNR